MKKGRRGENASQLISGQQPMIETFYLEFRFLSAFVCFQAFVSLSHRKAIRTHINTDHHK